MSDRRWFHPNISGLEAEQLLLEKGQNGSFLCRPSESNIGDFTLSVRRGEQVTHVKIKNNGGRYDFHGGEVFASLTELVEYYMEHELKEKTGEVIHLMYPVNAQVPTNERWYHGMISGKEAERLLLDRGKHGSFLVRESVSSPGDYVLSARMDDDIKHIMIRRNNGFFDVGGGPTFPQLADLIDNYKKNAMVEKIGGTVVHLKAPFNATRVTATEIADRVKELMKDNAIVPGKSGFWEEFDQLQREEDRHLYTRNEGQKQENKSKNRYKNILPFDHTRVKLSDVDPDIPGSDYINANFIDEDTGLKYIATQGCLPETVDDFWRMVYFQDCQIILNVTRVVERQRTKCAKYWPDVNQTLEGNRFDVKSISEKETPEYIFRELEVTHKKPRSETKRVRQYHYTGWPEHGAPPDPGSVLEVLHDVCLGNRNHHGPIVAHCSNGIGRTGTFIVINILLGILQKHGLDAQIDIPKTIQLVRSQRSGLVQTETQYKFIYLALEHYVETEKRRQGMSAPRPLDFGIGPPSPHYGSGKRTHFSTGDAALGNERIPGSIDRRFQPNDPPPPVPMRRPVRGDVTSIESSHEASNGITEPTEENTPPPIPSKDTAPPIPPRTTR